MVEVTQADRDAAAEQIAVWGCIESAREAHRIRLGQYDSHSLVQAFARHVIEAKGAEIAKRDDIILKLGENAYKAATEYSAEIARLREQYLDLIMKVTLKHPDETRHETRHETARRYIEQAERSPSIDECQARKDTYSE